MRRSCAALAGVAGGGGRPVGLGGIAALDLSRSERPVAAFVLAMALTALAGAATTLLVTRLLAAQRRRPARHAHRASEPRPAGRPHLQALARSRRTGRAVRAARRRPRRVQGRQRHPWPRGRATPSCAIARRLESVVRETDTVARVGGDEFVVLSLGTAEDDGGGRARRPPAPCAPHALPGRGGARRARRLHRMGALPPGRAHARPTCSRGRTGRCTRRSATRATSRCIPRPPLDGGVVRDLEHALEQGEIVVHYQPIVELPRASSAPSRRSCVGCAART